MQDFKHRRFARIAAVINLIGSLFCTVVITVEIGPYYYRKFATSCESGVDFARILLLHISVLMTMLWILLELFLASLLIIATRKDLEGFKAHRWASTWRNVILVFLIAGCIRLFQACQIELMVAALIFRSPMIYHVSLFIHELGEFMATEKVQEPIPTALKENANHMDEGGFI